MDENPQPDTRTKDHPCGQDAVPASILRFTFGCMAAGIFLGGVALCIWFVGRRDLLSATASIIGALMAIPFLAEGTRRNRIATGLTILCLVLGLIAGGALYIGLFHFPWWQAIFGNNKTGPMGLALFVSGFAAAGFLCGRRFVRISDSAEEHHH